MRSLEEVQNYFVYHAPTEEQRDLYERLNSMWQNVAEMLWEVIPPENQPSPDKTVMFRQLSDMRMQANLVVACYVPNASGLIETNRVDNLASSGAPASSQTPRETPAQGPDPQAS